jgi:hypothetical protein
MKNINTIITVVSWEERFLKGFKINLAKSHIENVIFFQFKGYEGRNTENYGRAKQLCAERNIAFIEKTLDFFDPKLNWLTIRDTITSFFLKDKKALIDITTMPRETIWTILFFLQQAKTEIKYVYYSPKRYNSDWLSRDPGDPRLLYKMSGISELGNPTLLFVFTGYDYQRVSNLVNHFEPQKLIIAHCNDEKGNVVAKKCIKEFDGNMTVEEMQFEIHHSEKSYDIILKKVEDNFRNFNIVFSSLGPKSSAITLYRVNRRYPETALCYIPCKEFNINYSEGIIEDVFTFEEVQIPERKYELLTQY